MLLAGSSGYLTYYGNEVIHETLLGAIVLAMLILMAAFAARPNLWKAAGIGCVAGLMFATKITSLFYFASWGYRATAVGGVFPSAMAVPSHLSDLGCLGARSRDFGACGFHVVVYGFLPESCRDPGCGEFPVAI